jgi:hypothetical protein
MNREEALSEIRQTAKLILEESREPVTRVRLPRDIFHSSTLIKEPDVRLAELIAILMMVRSRM